LLVPLTGVSVLPRILSICDNLTSAALIARRRGCSGCGGLDGVS
jgi:hypothetical protein